MQPPSPFPFHLGSLEKGRHEVFQVYKSPVYTTEIFWHGWDLRRGSPSTGKKGTGAEKIGTVRIEQVV